MIPWNVQVAELLCRHRGANKQFFLVCMFPISLNIENFPTICNIIQESRYAMQHVKIMLLSPICSTELHSKFTFRDYLVKVSLDLSYLVGDGICVNLYSCFVWILPGIMLLSLIIRMTIIECLDEVKRQIMVQ